MAESRTDRIARLLDTIRVERQTTIEQLARTFGVSTATIRRDIKTLEKEGAVVQTVGGGVRHQVEAVGPLQNPASVHAIEEKIRIAEYCAELVADQDDIIIGPGTTAFLAGRIMSGVGDKRFRIITNSLELAIETCSVPNIRTIIIGGEVWNNLSVGPAAGGDYLSFCHKRHTLIFSADGVQREDGVTVFETRLVPVYRQMLAVSSRVVLALDSSKFGQTRYNRLASFDELSMVITDDGAPKEYVEFLRNQKVEVVLV
jgi:DeoR family transcriptional regulator, glucitol operon repressor